MDVNVNRCAAFRINESLHPVASALNVYISNIISVSYDCDHFMDKSSSRKTCLILSPLTHCGFKPQIKINHSFENSSVMCIVNFIALHLEKKHGGKRKVKCRYSYNPFKVGDFFLFFFQIPCFNYNCVSLYFYIYIICAQEELEEALLANVFCFVCFNGAFP